METYLLIAGWLGMLVAAAFGLRQRHRLAQAQKALRNSQREARYHRISSEYADAGLLVQDMDGTVLWANEAYCRMMCRTQEEVIGRNPLSFVLPPERAQSPEQIAAFRYDPDVESVTIYENMRGDGQRIWVEIDVSFYDNEEGQKQVILVCRDITAKVAHDRKLAATSAELGRLAAHDTLTGAANRAAFTRFTTEQLASASADSRVGLLHIDLDRFKQINDTYGHAAGDAVLVAIAKRIGNALPDHDLISRMGGDEFVVVCTRLQTLAQLHSIAQRLISATNRPISWNDRTLQCGISIGGALSDTDTRTTDDLLKQADFALYEVKQTGRGTVVTYDRDMHSRHARQAMLARDLREAVAGGGLTFAFQPIAGLLPGDIHGLETLVRWDHPAEGRIMPDDFLPLAESLGLMADIDFLAVEAAMDMKLRLNAASHGHLKVTFNTSSQVLSHPDFLNRITLACELRGLQPGEITVEVLETVIFGTHLRQAPVVEVIAALTEAGFVTYLDDFGRGNAGLAQLTKLSLTGVKLDKSLTRGIVAEGPTRTVYATLIQLCANLGLEVITEGVETADEAAIIASLGGTAIQGYHIAKPLPADQVLPWLDANSDCSRRNPPRAKGQLIA